MWLERVGDESVKIVLKLASWNTLYIISVVLTNGVQYTALPTCHGRKKIVVDNINFILAGADWGPKLQAAACLVNADWYKIFNYYITAFMLSQT